MTIASLLHELGAERVSTPAEGSDIDPSVQAAGIPAMSLDVGGNYFLIHHTQADTVDKISPIEIAKCAAAIAVMTYVVADLARGSSGRSQPYNFRRVPS